MRTLVPGNAEGSENAGYVLSPAEGKTLPLRVAVLCDLLEEGWQSMDLVGDMLLASLDRDHRTTVSATRICPPMRRRAVWAYPQVSSVTSTDEGLHRDLFSLDLLANRYLDYPRSLRRRTSAFDVFHIVDHSYAHLVHALPSERTVVTCHDLEAFRSILPVRSQGLRLWPYRAMAERTLTGLMKAARVVCATAAIRDDVIALGLIAPDRLEVVPNGVHPACTPDPNPEADMIAARFLGAEAPGAVNLLHVGSTVPRKRIDVLLRTFSLVQREFPNARLIRVGGAFTPDQERLVQQLDLGRSIVALPFLDRAVLAAVYRRAALVLQPSEIEGFGLPVIEAMACGTPVVASDLPVLREVGGEAAAYCSTADVPAWSEAVVRLLNERELEPDRWSVRRSEGITQAARFSWREYAGRMVSIYLEVLNWSPVAF